MLFWIVAALLTLGASLAVLAPLARGRRSVATAADHDLEVYKDQLRELERDTERGLIAPAEAEQARAEIGRRILKLGERTDGGQSALVSPMARMAGMAAVLAVPVVSWALYGYLGSPDLPSQPLQARLEADPAKSSIDELVARAEKHLAANPNDGKGWDVLAPVYLRMGRFSDAVDAYRTAIRLEGSTAARESGLGEALASAADGVISDEAETAFERALRLEPDYPKARFYLASALAQDGKMQEAIAAWREMIVKLPADSPWRVPVEQAVAEAEKRLAAGKAPSTTSGTSAAGPTQEEVDAAASMSDADRTAMIETMVAGLDQKLRQNPRDPEGWQRLIRSYMVLGRKADALEALKRGMAALGEGSAEAAALSQFSSTLGLSRTE
jgi:cytochrome c-type biogenesis protein CcmH